MGAPDVADTFKTTYVSNKDFQMTKPIDALKTIARYVEAKKPKTLAEAEHMLDLISVMADETILDEDAAESSLAKGLISKPFFPEIIARPSPAGPGRRSAASCSLVTGAGDRGEYRKATPALSLARQPLAATAMQPAEKTAR